MFSKLFRLRSVQVAALAFVVAAAIFVPTKLVHASAPADCDANAVVWCGAYNPSTGNYDLTTLMNAIANGDGHNSAASIQSIYSGFGVNTANLPTAVDGVVTSSGQVIVNGQVVASGVWTAGRQFIPGSVSMNGVYMRPPSVSFLSSQLDAYVLMNGTTFEGAVLKACGNPVFSIKAPFGLIYKRVVLPNGSTVDADTQATAASEAAGSTFQYQIYVQNAGTTDMTNTVVTDNLPAGIVDAADPSSRDLSANIGTVKAGQATYVTLTAKVTDTTVGDCINNVASFTADSNQSGSNNAWICVTNIPPSSSPTPTPTPSNTPTPTPSSTPTPTPSNTPTPTPSPSNTPTPTPLCTVQPTATTPACSPTPSTLVQTGPEGGLTGLAGVGGVGSMGYALRAYLRSKRNLLSARKKK